MRLLANENIPFDLVRALREDGHDVLWIRNEAPGSADSEVLALAQEEERILLTFDKDFGELAFRSKLSAASGVILFRVPMTSSSFIARLVLGAIRSRDDWPGHFAVVESDRVRLKQLPVKL
jgi:predicted nuclease of predicted toxin-antitoxin system